MKEIISIHIGQGGVQVGSSCWELFCLEHGILPDGKMIEGKVNDNDELMTFFQETARNSYVPRSVFIDLEPTVIDKIRTGTFKSLFNKEDLMTGKQDSSNIFCRGHYSIGRSTMIESSINRIRKLVEKCQNLQGILVYHALGGGTGSGFGTLLLQRLAIDHPKKPKFCFSIVPSPKLSTGIVEPYNSVLSLNYIMEDSEACIILDNEAMYDICERKLDVERSSYSNINRLIAQVVSSLTSSIRFKGPLNMNLSSFRTNLIPYQRIKFLLSSYAPLSPAESTKFCEQTVEEITKAAFDRRNMMVKCDPRSGRYMACAVMYRGDVIPRDVVTSIANLKSDKTVRFVDWCPTGFKVSVSPEVPKILSASDFAKPSRDCCTISNSTAINQVFDNICCKFDLMYSKRGFVYWFIGEGQDQGEFSEARENLAAIERDYQECNNTNFKDNEE